MLVWVCRLQRRAPLLSDVFRPFQPWPQPRYGTGRRSYENLPKQDRTGLGPGNRGRNTKWVDLPNLSHNLEVAADGKVRRSGAALRHCRVPWSVKLAVLLQWGRLPGKWIAPTSATLGHQRYPQRWIPWNL